MRPIFLLAVLPLVFSCRAKSAEAKPDPVTKDATPHEDASPPLPPFARVVFHNKIIDLGAASVIHTFGPDVPPLETMDVRSALVFGKDHALRSYDLADAHERWKFVPMDPCVGLGLAPKHAFCATATEVLMIDGATGVAKAIAPSTKSPIREGREVGNAFVVRHDDGTLDSFDASSGAIVATTKLAYRPWGFRTAFVMRPPGDTFCAVGHGGSDFEVGCYDPRLAVRWAKTVVLRKPTDPPSTSFGVRQNGPNHVVLGSHYFGKVRRSVVIRLSDGMEVARVEDEVAATVDRPDGSLEGLLVTTPEVRMLETSGAVRWTSTKIPKNNDGAAIARDDRIFLATYEGMASGASIHAVHRKSGALLWHGDHEQLMIAHSIYLNGIELSLIGDSVVMHGEEASISYIQIFAVGDGRRSFSDTRYTF